MKTIYIRTNLKNGMQYVGQTDNIRQREWSWKCLKNKYANTILDNDRLKYGFENFKIEIVKVCDDSEGDFFERYYIEKYNTIYPNGYNMSSGGEKKWKLSEIVKKNMSKSKIGDKNPFFKKHHSEEQKIKWSIDRKGKIVNNPKNTPVIQKTKDNIIVNEFRTIRQAARETGIDRSSISNCINGKAKTAGGFIWIKKNL